MAVHGEHARRLLVKSVTDLLGWYVLPSALHDFHIADNYRSVLRL